MMPSNLHDAFKRAYARGYLSVGSKCNLKCFYCTRKWNPEGLLLWYNDFLTVDEVKHFLSFVPDKHIDCIGGAVNEIYDGEFFMHPKSVEILEHVRDQGFAVNQVYTNGTLITEDDMKVVKEIAIRDEIAIHLTHWKKTNHAFALADKYGIPYSALIVPTRNDIDRGRIERWIQRLQDHDPLSIRILFPGYTKYMSKRFAEQMAVSNEEIRTRISKWSADYPRIDIDYQFGKHHEESIQDSLRRFKNEYPKYTDTDKPRLLFLISESVEEFFENSVQSLAIENYRIVTVKNETFGGNVVVSGLLLIDDYSTAIEEALATGYEPEFLVLTANSFPYDDADLRGVPAASISDKFGIPMMWC